MFYRFLQLTIGIAVRIFFRRVVLVGRENIDFSKPTIIVSNHPSAFMDPLVTGILYEETQTLRYFETHPLFARLFVRINRCIMVMEDDIVWLSIEGGVHLKDKTFYSTTQTWLPNILARMGR